MRGLSCFYTEARFFTEGLGVPGVAVKHDTWNVQKCSIQSMCLKFLLYALALADRTDRTRKENSTRLFQRIRGYVWAVRKLLPSEVGADEDGLWAVAMELLIQMCPLLSVRLDATLSMGDSAVGYSLTIHHLWYAFNNPTMSISFAVGYLEPDSSLGTRWYVCLGR